MNFKVKCVGYNFHERKFTIGKVYDVKNGMITNDYGFTYKNWGETFEDLYNRLDFWYDFVLVEESSPEIHITVKGNETIAVYKNGTEYKKAVAKCSPEDTFDFGVGAKLALERLGVLPADPVEPVEMKYEPKYFTGKAVCVDNYNALSGTDSFTIGKVYEFEEGKTHDDDGDIRPVNDLRCFVGDKYLEKTNGDWSTKFLPLAD